MSCVRKSDIQEVMQWLGKRSYKVRLEKFGLETLQQIARENGKKGGRPKRNGKKKKKEGGN
jgi:hypothetical protein